MENNTLLVFFIGILVIGALLVVVIMLTKKGAVQLDVNKYRSKWMGIETQLDKNDLSRCSMAVLNADKLLDQAMREKGVKGQTMGERMKTLKETWSNANAVWGAHRLRNQIAHETDHRVTYDDARRALSGFKQALKDVGAI
jgi:fructose-specific phosphotransferase system component IIB